MPIDRERQRQVREGVEELRQMLKDPAQANVDDQDNVRCENLAEVIALVVAQARAAGSDATLPVEILLRSSDNDRETLLEAHQVLAALGYTEIAVLLKRFARNAPHRLTFRERMTARPAR
jgi:hypothetical protein